MIRNGTTNITFLEPRLKDFPNLLTFCPNQQLSQHCPMHTSILFLSYVLTVHFPLYKLELNMFLYFNFKLVYF